jgi:hypothetical protein
MTLGTYVPRHFDFSGDPKRGVPIPHYLPSLARTLPWTNILRNFSGSCMIKHTTLIGGIWGRSYGLVVVQAPKHPINPIKPIQCPEYG